MILAGRKLKSGSVSLPQLYPKHGLEMTFPPDSVYSIIVGRSLDTSDLQVYFGYAFQTV